MIRKSVNLRPKQAFLKTRDGVSQLEVSDAENDVRKLVNLIHSKVVEALSYPLILENKRLLEFANAEREHQSLETGKNIPKLHPSEEARQAGINYKDLPKEIIAKSRVETLIRDQVVSRLKKWDGNLVTKPKAGRSVVLGASNYQQVYMKEQGGSLWLFFKAWDRELIIEFNKPRSRQYKGYSKISLPTVSLNPNSDRLSWNFVFNYPEPRPRISDQFVLGVDRGVKELAVWSVRNYSTGETIADGFLSPHAKHISGKIRRLEAEVSGIRGKLEKLIYNHNLPRYTILYAQYKGKKKKIKRLKQALAKQAAQELVAISAAYDNCMIMVEDLSWAGNWHGKTPFGLLEHWLEHYALQSGTRVQRVNPAYSSQECSVCGVIDPGNLKSGREYRCSACGLRVDRDINAARIIAKRGSERARKSSVTRSKYCKTRKRPRVLKRKKLLIQELKREAGGGWVNHSVPSGLGSQRVTPLTSIISYTLNSYCYQL